jgi:uncharacterized membrane protein HdeD (DUF308 family)
MASSGGFIADVGGNARVLCRRTWWVFLLGGLASVVFGALAMMKPVTAWFLVSVFFAASIVVDGVFNVAGSVQHREKDGWWIMLLMGILGVAVGGYALLNPPVSMMVFLYVVAFQAVMLGCFLVMLGYKVRAATEREWILYLAGTLSVVFGILVIVNPVVGSISVITMIAVWALVTGALKILFAFRIRNLPDRIGDRRARVR